MGVTKTDKFTDEQNDLATLAKVLGHPARLAIIQHLVELNSCVCGELVEEIGLAQATISQHLKELKSYDLIKGEIEGTSVCYCLNFEKWLAVRSKFDSLFNQISESQSTCC